MSLYNKIRPTSFDELIGNKELVSSLKSMLTSEEIPQCYLLSGPTGCGKTTIARIIAKEINCVGSDLREIDIADFRGIDTIRDIRRNSNLSPLEGETRMWILDECHKLTTDAQNALLKLLEDPPKFAYFVLCTTDPQKLIKTVRDRCQQFQVELLKENELVSLLQKITKKLGKKLELEIIEQIADTSNGYVRPAIQSLEKILKSPEKDRMKIAKQKIDEQAQIIELCRLLLKNAQWKTINTLLKELKGHDAEEIRRIVLGYCQAILLNGENDRAAFIIEEFWEPFYNIGFPGLVFTCYSIYKEK